MGAVDLAVKDDDGVALGSRLAVARGLPVQEEGVEDDHENATWFCVLTRDLPASLRTDGWMMVGAPVGQVPLDEILDSLSSPLPVHYIWTVPPWDFLEVTMPAAADLSLELMGKLIGTRGPRTRLIGAYAAYDRRGMMLAEQRG